MAYQNYDGGAYAHQEETPPGLPSGYVPDNMIDPRLLEYDDRQEAIRDRDVAEQRLALDRDMIGHQNGIVSQQDAMITRQDNMFAKHYAENHGMMNHQDIMFAKYREENEAIRRQGLALRDLCEANRAHADNIETRRFERGQVERAHDLAIEKSGIARRQAKQSHELKVLDKQMALKDKDEATRMQKEKEKEAKRMYNSDMVDKDHRNQRKVHKEGLKMKRIEEEMRQKAADTEVDKARRLAELENEREVDKARRLLEVEKMRNWDRICQGGVAAAIVAVVGFLLIFFWKWV